jgi:glycosyltransferase involved in cell wall biosynthesis
MTASRREPTALIAHPGAELYGSDLVLLESVSALLESGVRVTVALPDDGPLVAELTGRGATTVLCRTPVLRKRILSASGAVAFLATALIGVVTGLRLLRRIRPDLLYVNTVTLPLWILLGRIVRIPVIAHVHEAERDASALVRAVLSAPLLLCETVIANSEHCRDVVSESYPSLRRRTVVVTNPIAGPARTGPARMTLSKRVRLVYVGRLSERKGVDTAVRAVALYRAGGRAVELHLIGAVFPGYEWYQDRLRTLVHDEGLDGVVHFHGYQRDVWPHLAAGDIVLVPSVLEEGFGNTAVEGTLAARPVIVSDTSGLREASSGFASALRVPPGDGAALSAAVSRIVRDWPYFRQAAATDHFLAQARHAPAGYRSSIRQAVLGSSARAPVVASPPARHSTTAVFGSAIDEGKPLWNRSGT